MRIITSFFILFSGFAFGQNKENYAAVDAKMAAIPVSETTTPKGISDYIAVNFKTEKDRLRASFYWVASNISYDVANMENIEFSDSSEQKVNKTLKNRKGVCIHYAEVFNTIVKQLGFEAYIVEGYTKQFGKVAALSHAWNVVKSEGKWWFFDSTWGAGSVNKGVFAKKLNNFYFKTPAAAMVATHMPFDYLWQLSSRPISNQSFITGRIIGNTAIGVFDFTSEIEKLKEKSGEIQLFEAIKRIEANGVITYLVESNWSTKKMELVNLRNNSAVEKLNAIIEESNTATALFNDFILYRNKQFKPMQSDDAIRAMILTPKEKVLACQKKLESLGPVLDSNKAMLLSFRKNLTELQQQIDVQEKFVNDYLSKRKLGRKTMFSKATWFGVPLN